MTDRIEEIARIIDPEAFGLPDNIEDGTITDRDVARDRARRIAALFSPSAREEALELSGLQEAKVESGFYDGGPSPLAADNAREDQLTIQTGDDLTNEMSRRSSPAQGVPEGWKLVPIEPTNEQSRTGEDYFNKHTTDSWEGTYRPTMAAIYRAMLVAAPEPK